MRKEVIFAIIIGLILGTVILYGIRLAETSAKKAAANLTPTVAISATPTPTQAPPTLTIISPQDHSVVVTEIIKIVGRTAPNSSIALASEGDDNLVDTDSNGNFETDFKLAGGENTIQITSLASDGQTQTTSLSIIYTTAKID